MQEKEKKPRIRFKGFTEAWEQRKFGNYGSVSMCKRVFKNETSDNGDIPFYKIGTFGEQADAFISNEKYEYYKSKFSYPNKGDILLSASGTIGRIVEYTGEKAYFQDSNIVWLNHNDNIKNSFLKVLYPTVKWDGIEGSTIKRLYNSNFLNTDINVPKIIEQEKIGLFFNNIDNLITLHQRKYDKLVNVKKALLEKIFPKNGSNVPEIRFKGFTEAWEQRKLTEFVDFFNGQTYSPSNVQANGTLVLRSSNVQHGEISKDDCVYISNNVVNSSNVNIGDIIVVVRNGSRNLIGKHAQIKVNMPNTVIGAFMTGIRAKDSNFINALLSTQLFESEINKNMGATINQITGYMFANMEFYIPKNKEQLNIGKLFLNIDNLITLHQRKLEKLKNIKKSLLEKMFV